MALAALCSFVVVDSLVVDMIVCRCLCVRCCVMQLVDEFHDKRVMER